MSTTHLAHAHAFGVAKALEKVGYKSAAEVIKEAQDLGLNQGAPKAAPILTLSSR